MRHRIPLVLLLLAAPGFAQLDAPPVVRPFELVSVSPTPNATAVDRTAPLAMEFSLPVDVTTLSPPDFHVMGRWSGPCIGTLATRGNGRVVTFTPTQPFSAGETVYVVLSKSVRSTSGATLGRGHAWSFWVDSRASTAQFTHIDTLFAGNIPYGGYGGDIDADGDLDLCVPNEATSDVSVFLNGGQGNFGSATSYAVGFHCSPSEAADFDFDGNLDLAVSNILDNDVSILFGNGDGTFQPQVRHDVGNQPRGLALLDADGDGDVDIVTANRQSGDVSLLLNDGTGGFAPEVSFQGGVSNETGVSACDMNNDGYFDLVIAGYGNSRVSVMLGDGSGAFQVASTQVVGQNPWMVVTGDVNGDGFNDVGAILAAGDAAAVAFNDQNDGLLAPATYPAGDFPIALDFGDLNGDGRLDLTTSSFNSGQFRVFWNGGSGAFQLGATLPATTAGSCTVLHDFDGDGDVDITGIDELADVVFLYRQDG